MEGKNFGVVDVYDQAADIGKEFEKIIEIYGVESVTELMPKVIRTLEYLELLAQSQEGDNAEVEDLRDQISRLQTERASRLYERDKYEQELESIEDSWKEEGKELLKTVTSLQEENKRLRETLSDRCDSENKNKDRSDKEHEMVARMKETIEKQRSELRSIHREMQQKTLDVEAMSAQIERLARTNAELRSRQQATKRHASTLIADKTDLEAAIQDKDQHLACIMEKIKSMDEDDKTLQSPTSPTCPVGDMSGKLVIDLSDPNRPRFTMHELRQVLLERNELKARLIEVQEELAYYKPKEEIPVSSPGDDAKNDEAGGLCSGVMSRSDFDRPVQGPVNKEPDEKLYDLQERGIRRFFKRVLEKLSD